MRDYGSSLYMPSTAILREVAKFLTAMILAHAQFVLRTPVDTFKFVRHVILEGGATAKETPVAEAEPDAIAESGPQPKVSIFRKTNCACAKIIAVRNFATSRTPDFRSVVSKDTAHAHQTASVIPLAVGTLLYSVVNPS